MGSVRIIDTGVTIDTPEGVSFRHELSSLSDRALAYALDLGIRVGVLVVVGLIMAIALGPAMLAGAGLWMVLYFVLEWGYYVFFELLWNGQSPGKRVLGLRVVKTAGHPIGFYDSVMRNLLRAADAMPPLLFVGTYASGALTMLFTHRFQRLGDLAAGTMVVCERSSYWARATANATAPDRTTPPQLRGLRLSAKEKRLLESFAERVPRLHVDRAEELASLIARPLAAHMGRGFEGSATSLLLALHAQTQREAGSTGR